MGSPRHTEQKKLDTLIQLQANGGNATKTGRDMGVSEKAVRTWRDGKHIAPATLQALKEGQRDITIMWQNVAHMALHGIEQKDFEKVSLPQRAVIAGIASDKAHAYLGASALVSNADTVFADIPTDKLTSLIDNRQVTVIKGDVHIHQDGKAEEVQEVPKDRKRETALEGLLVSVDEEREE